MTASLGLKVRLVLPIGFEDEFDLAQALSAARAAARMLKATWECIALGGAGDGLAGEAVFAAGARKLWFFRHNGLPASATAAQMARVCRNALDVCPASPDALYLVPACDAGEELAGRMAAARGAAALGRIQALVLRDGIMTALRDVFGSRATAHLQVRGEGWAVLRAKGLATAEEQEQEQEQVQERGQAEFVELKGQLPLPPLVTTEPLQQAGRRLEGARLVVAGGRGIGGPEGFEQLRALAEMLGGALGASLVAVDEGWAPVTRQVGQSGKFITPELYLAVGISGAPHHLAGLGDGTRIVAINSDPEAEIFRRASVGCVGDWRELIPLLIENLRVPVQA